MVTKRIFGRGADGCDVFVFRLDGADGAYMEVTNYGAIWARAVVPDRDGNLTDVCLSYESIEGYMTDTMYVGAVVGRFANRIKGAAFTLNGKVYRLQKNDGENSLHGGFDGYGKRVFDYEVLDGGVAFRLLSPDGDQGYPGNLAVTVTYSFDANNVFAVDYHAISDQDTPVNLTNHAYFNLAGAGAGRASAIAQILRINSGFITEVDREYIPTGKLLPLENTPLDFRMGDFVGERFKDPDPQMEIAGGYDFNYIVDGCGLREAAVLTCPRNGVSMRLFMTNPGLQFYSGNMIARPFIRQSAVCLEPQHYPDSVNRPAFPSCVLKAGESYRARTEYRFSAV